MSVKRQQTLFIEGGCTKHFQFTLMIKATPNMNINKNMYIQSVTFTETYLQDEHLFYIKHLYFVDEWWQILKYYKYVMLNHSVFNIFSIILAAKYIISTALMIENPVSNPMVPPIADNMSTNFAALSLVILSKVGVSK